MHYTADQLQQELARFAATLAQAGRRAGRGLDHDFERRLDAHRRVLSDMLGADGAPLVMDAVVAAKSALRAREPFHDLRAMERARDTLERFARRRLLRGAAPVAAAPEPAAAPIRLKPQVYAPLPSRNGDGTPAVGA
ncbi:hypothetical protein [Vulcaniibacterium tengchongense]|uniref:Uncharacterized protein n=1 Tax=Vulcaniibacterium tengchongense TaxID=1273429 RepID=A0A3N4VJM6_9GAMM|nr:hypothetical protein [Vulcaniibacterium tengchongense]RPE77227.1 hypothetical protein EDC50_2492 [Vulcaniibacterium tengchongense]